MAHFPLFIDIKGRKCLIIGGGKVAGRKTETLLKFGADVRVISPEVDPEIIRLLSGTEVSGKAGDSVRMESLTHREARGSVRIESLTPDELEKEISDSALVMAASSSREMNHQTAVICHRLGIPVNVADAPAECTFFFPAVVQKGDISIGINTGGQSPILSSRIRREIEETIPDYYADIAGQLGDLRSVVREKISEECIRRQFLKKAAAAAFLKNRPLTPEEIDALFRSIFENTI